MNRGLALLVLVSCTAPKSGGPTEAANDTSAHPRPDDTSDRPGDDTSVGPADDSAGDTAETCPEPPWRSAEPGASFAFGAGSGVDTSEAEAASAVSAALLADPGVAGVFWREAGTDRYALQTQDGESSFVRSRDAAGDLALAWASSSPLLDDPMADPTLADELSYGNPEGTTYPDQGYPEGDARLSFPTVDEASHPRIPDRIAQIFDADNGPDLGLILAPYAAGGTGTHGGFSLPQSRAPLWIRGPGVVSGTYEIAADQVDIAPTLAGLLGVSPVTGVNGRTGRWVDGQMLRWQDGRVLDELLVDTCAWGAASRAVVLILDGLSHTEVLDGLSEGRLPHLARIADQAAIASAGAIVGWPSMSLPGHLSVHTGVYQGHHGLLSNSFRDRSTSTTAPGIDLFDILADPEAGTAAMDAYLSTEIETLFEAVGRTFPDAYTASINELTFRGTTYGRHAPAGPPSPAGDYTRYRVADQSAILQAEVMVDDIGLPKLLAVSLYLSDGAGEGEGPHGDDLRDALVETDERVGQLLDLYAREGGFEDTVFVLTADHGMALQDSARTSAWSSALSSSGVPLTSFGHLIYLD
jgi:hypothetical protein